ncbi:DNA replication/repair protein RecF [Spelaeicoccus albus]|uniref:DNA replication and repair protein RecF n=1 Tax=Spelaeicoccus albus TaxID=1280376 RepID=A0A7Z0D191_9MICO|nr:DNA replication/repair protein RecF [Spelaeicoccus albus]NYI66593.1 DNA replication and repair protein RecF [Spelaeicoccus albus]
MYVSHLGLLDFRSYPRADVRLDEGVTVFVGANGQGKTNLVESIGYLAGLHSHRVSADLPLVRHGSDAAFVRAKVVRGERTAIEEVQIAASGSNKARLNGNPVKPRDLLGVLTAVTFAPEDLGLVKGDPGERRRFLDDLLTARRPRFAAVRSEYDKVLKQRNALLKTAKLGGGARNKEATLEVWDHHLARAGAALLAGRIGLTDELTGPVARAYSTVSGSGGADDPRPAGLRYRRSTGTAGDGVSDGSAPTVSPSEDALFDELMSAFAANRRQETERGITLFGPHRDDLELLLGPAPAKGYASHGESWSFALALRLASFELLTHDAGDRMHWPVLILDDVFAELDSGRRRRLAGMVAEAEQVLVTAAVPGDVPEELTRHAAGRVIPVRLGEVGEAGEGAGGTTDGDPV